MATNNDNPKTLAERVQGIDENIKAMDERAKEWAYLYNASAAPNHKSTPTKPTQTTSGQSTPTATTPYVYEAKTSRRSTGLTPADQQKATNKTEVRSRATTPQKQIQRDATAYTPAVKQRPPMKSPTEQKREESQTNATPLKIMEAEQLGIDKYNYQMELPQEFVSEFDGGDISKLLQHVSMSQDDDYNERLLEAAIRYVNTTYPNESVVEFNGKKYDKGSLAMALVPIMRENGHGYLMQNNANYRDDWAAKQGFGNFNVWLAAMDKELAKIQEEIDKSWKDKVSDDMVLKVGTFLSPINYLVGRDALGIKHIRDLRDSIDLMRNGDYSAFDTFMKGAEEGFDYLNMLTFDISGTAAETMREAVLDKAYNGKELTADEERILKIYEMEQEIKGYDHNTGSTARQLGNTMGYMGQELPQYLFVGGKIAGGVTKGFTKLATKYTPNVVKGVVKAAFGKNKIAPLRWGLKAAGDYASGLVAAPFTPGTYERLMEMRNEQFSIEDGKLKKDPTSAIRDGLKVWFEQAGEIGSELTGARMADFLDSSLLSLGGELGVYKLLNKVKPTIGGVETSKALRYAKSSSHRAAQQAVQYTGDAFTEGLGEAWGSYTSEIMKEAVLGEGNFEQFYDADFWAMTFGASGLAGLGFGAPTTAMDWVGYYHDLRTLSGTKKEALSKIEHTDLKNALTTLSAGGNIKESTEHLANLDWENGGYSREEIGYAMDYIRAEAMQQVRMGEATESERLQRFGKVAQAIDNITYHNEVGKATDSIISAMDKEGNTYYILEGDITNPEAMLKALDKNGNTVSLLASNVSGYSKASVADTTEHHYKEMFSQEYNEKRLAKVQQAVDELINPPMDLLAQIAKRVGIVMPKEGDTITLVDGRTAKVTSISDDLGIMAEMTDGEGNASQVTIPIMQILSSNTYIAEAQKLQNAEDALELAQTEEAQMEAQDAAEENADATSGMEETTTEKVTEDGLIGTEVTLPNGTKGTIAEVAGDDVVVDTGRGVDAYEVYSKEELGMTEAEGITTTPAEATTQSTQTTAEQTTGETTTEQTTGEVTPEQATEALNEIAGIKPVPSLEDGSIDYDAIDDAETFAKHFEHDMGGREEAIEGVKEMREQAMADLAEAEKKGKKARSANDKVANKKLREQLAERIAFYDNVLDVYSQKAEAAAPTESVAEVDTTPSTAEVTEVAETTPQTMEAETTATPQETETRTETAETTEEVAEEEALSAEEIWAAERREGYAVPDQNGQLIGLVRNELSAQLEKSVRILLNDVATAFGISIVFQREVRSSAGNLVNGKIEGTTVYFNWGKREHTLTWLMGHEFTHRMKSLAPEAYNKLRDAVRAYLGEEKWNQLIEKQRKIYEERENPEEILSYFEREAIGREAWEQTKREDGSYNEEAAKELYNKKVAEARREAYIEEVVCDEVGVLARDHKAFDRFLRSEHVRNDGKFLRWLRKVWQSIKNAFSHDARTFNEVMKTLDELINVSTAKVAKGVEPTKGGENNSLVGEQNAETPEVAEAVERIESKGGVVDAQRGDVKYALSDVLTVPERESAIQDLMRVTGRSRATVQKYLKAEQSLARIIADDDNRAFLDLQVDESVPSIWNNSDYPQGTVEFSNICRKRLPLTMIYQQLQKEFPNTVFDASTLETIRGVLKENGIDVACGLCFVEDRRQLLGEIGNGFISALKGENVDVNEKQKEAIASLKDTYIPNLYELLTLDGMKALKKTHPEVANAFVAYNNARGMQAGRLFQAYSAYHREILGYSEARVNKINASGGLRIFSFSDFEAHHLIDLVQVLTDCARKGIKVQGYTKVPEFARAVKDTGMKLNRSLIAKGDGYVDADYSPKENEAVSPNVVDRKRLLLDCVEGIDVNHKDFFDSSSSHNVGNILVGINDEQIRLAMLDPFVDYIIPFHSGLSEAIRKQKGIGDWQNYKLEQLEKKDNGSGKLVNADKHGVNIYTEVLSDDIKTEKQFVERYLEVCKEKGWVPKFHRFLKKDKNGDFVYTKGYYKLLLDFKMFDSKGRILPQEVVQPIFDDAFNKEILEDYVKGEKAKMPNDEVYEEVKEALGLSEKTKFSLATDVASILEEYDTDGVKYGSIHDVADGIEAVIAESTEDTTELENILNDFRAAQDDARRWGNRMDSGGEEEFEEALRAYASQGQPKYSMQTINALSDALSDYNTNGDIVAFVDKVREANDKFGEHPYLTNVVMDYDEEGDAEWFVSRIRNVVGEANGDYAPYTAGGVRYSLISPEMDADYLSAVERGDMATAQRMVMEAAKKAGYTEEVYHGTSAFGFQIFRSHRPSGAIFTSSRANVAANYGGDAHYASVRAINKGYKEPASSEDTIQNAQSVLGQEYHIATEAEREKVIKTTETEAKRVVQKMEALKENAGELPSDIADNIAWIENIIYSGATSRENGNEGDELYQMLRDDYERFVENKDILKDHDSSNLTKEQKEYINYLKGYEVGDVAIDIANSYANAVSSQELASIGGVLITIDRLNETIEGLKEIGTYHLMGDLGTNPLIIDAEDKAWYALEFNGMHDTDAVVEWAKENGYTSVVFKNIYDYGDKSDVKVFYSSNQLKSADPVTYDDAGNVIPLSERFNPRKEDIRYSLIGEMGASNIESYGRYGSPAYALEQARDMEADGKSVKEIRVATNWERGKDGKWRYEINDGVYIDPEDKDKEYKLSDILKNDALYEAYPELADMPVYYTELEGNKRGMYDGEAIWLRKTLDEQQAHSTLVHEVQHAIQHREGFARGGNKGMFEQEAIEKLEKTLGDLESEKDKFKSYSKLRKAYLILKYVANSLRLDRAESKAHEQYRRLAGEVEARNVQARMNMSEEERLLIPIGSTEDVARSSQNVIQRELMAADGTRYSLREESAPTRYSLHNEDVPFYTESGDRIIFDDVTELEEERREFIKSAHHTPEDVVRSYAQARHFMERDRIRKEADRAIERIRKEYIDEDERRKVGVANQRTNVGKVDFILHDVNRETMPIKDQLLVDVAQGAIKIIWGESTGLASAIGLPKSDKKHYKNIWKGATKTFDEFVADWIAAHGGAEKGLDFQSVRTALIEVLRDTNKPADAIDNLRTKYADLIAERDAKVKAAKAEMEQKYSEEDARYNAEVESLKTAEGLAQAQKYYKENIAFTDELNAIRLTISELERKLNETTKEEKVVYRTILNAIREAKAEIKEVLQKANNLKFSSATVQSILHQLDAARSINDLKAVRDRVEGIILERAIRHDRAEMQALLNMHFPKTKGVKKARTIDDETKRVIIYLRDKLIAPEAKRRRTEKVDEDGKVVYNENGKKVYVYEPELELSLDVEEHIATNKERIEELLNTPDGESVRSLTEEEKAELTARELYDHYLKTVAFKQQEANLRKQISEEKSKDVVSTMYNDLNDIRRNYGSAIAEFNETLSDIIFDGKMGLRAFREAKEAHKAKVKQLAINAIKAKITTAQPNIWERSAARFRDFIHNTYYTYEMVLREIDRFAPNGEGEFYEYFMDGFTEANGKFITKQHTHTQSMGDKVKELWDKETKRKNHNEAYQYIMNKAEMIRLGEITWYLNFDKDGNLYNKQTTPLTMANAMDLLASWRQAQYKTAMQKHGITEAMMLELEKKMNAIDPRYIKFMDWVNTEFLPSTRLEYNEVHKQMFGTSMDNIKNYFPASVIGFFEDVDLSKDEGGIPLASTVTGGIMQRQKNNNMVATNQNYFVKLQGHIQNMDQWASFAPYIEDVNVILGKDMKMRYNSVMSGVNKDEERGGAGSLYTLLRTTASIAVGKYKYKTGKLDKFMSKVTRGWAGSNIAFRVSTALKQLSSLPIFAAYAADPKAVEYFAKTLLEFRHPRQLVGWATEISPSFKARWDSKYSGNEVLMREHAKKEAAGGIDFRKGKVRRVVETMDEAIQKFATEYGMWPNAAVDALVVAAGIKTIYDYELNKATGGTREATEEEKRKAIIKAEIFFNTTQQSAEGAYLSEIQMQSTFVTTAMNTYKSQSYAMHRKRWHGRKELFKSFFNKEYRRNLTAEQLSEARKRAIMDMTQGYLGDVVFQFMSACGVSAWAFINSMLHDYDDDDEETQTNTLEDIGKAYLNLSLGGFVGGSLVSGAIDGYGFHLTPAIEEFIKDAKEISPLVFNKKEDKLEWVGFNLWPIVSAISSYRYGVDPKTLINMAEGFEELTHGVVNGDMSSEAFMKIINTPQSIITKVSSKRRKGETVQEWVNRQMRVETLNIVTEQAKFEKLHDKDGKFIGQDELMMGRVGNPFTMPSYRAKTLLKDYNKRQRNAVMSKEFSKSEIERFKRIDEEYKKAVEPLGWKVGNKPEDNLVDKTGWKPIYPEGLSKEHYTNLKGIATEAEALQNAQEKWIGSDEALAAIIRKEYKYREAVIKGKRSPYEASFTKRGIEREKDIEKKQNKYKNLK
jgi:rRNA maturation protein Rpf1